MEAYLATGLLSLFALLLRTSHIVEFLLGNLLKQYKAMVLALQKVTTAMWLKGIDTIPSLLVFHLNASQCVLDFIQATAALCIKCELAAILILIVNWFCNVCAVFSFIQLYVCVCM